MLLNIKVWSRDKSAFTKSDKKCILDVLSRVPGLTVGKFDIATTNLIPKVTPACRIDWGWFAEKLTAKAEGYNCVVFHFPPLYRRKWKMLPKIAGTYRNDLDSILEFWMAPMRGRKAKGYKVDTEVTRIFLHELLHGFKRRYGGNSNDVHVYDYIMKDVAIGYYTIKL